MIKVDEGIFRGPEPTLVSDLAALKAAGIKYILDLETGSHTLISDGGPLDEARRADVYGIRTYSHPLGTILPPTRGELSLAIGVLLDLKPVYVHCRQGVDRTGMVCAYYRMKIMGWPRAAAIQEMKELGMHPWYFYWRWML